MRIKIGSNNRITFPRQFCEENNIQYGDEFELHFICNNIIFEHIDKNSTNTNIDTNTNTNKNTNTNINLDTIPNKNEKTNLIETIPNKIEETSNLVVNGIKLSGSLEFVPNLDESQNFYRKCYSECGLLCRTKPKYIKQYCQKCRGQMLAEEERSKYCSYIITANTDNIDNIDNTDNNTDNNDNIDNIKDINNNDNTDNINSIKNEEMSYIEKAPNIKVKQISDIEIKPSIAKVAILDNKTLISNITNNITAINKKLDNDIQDIVFDQIDIDFKDETYIQPIKYRHHHQCHVCDEFKDSGFLINDEHFLCRTCTVRSFINYRKLKRRNN